MTHLVKLAKQGFDQVESAIRSKIEKIKADRKNGDDTVEAQAETFRIWMWSSAAGLSIIVIASVISMASHSEEARKTLDASSEKPTSMLDALPDGYVIAPIQPTNNDSLDSIFEQHGYVDLYRAGATGSKGKIIARGLPLVRAPKNPRQFAVLVPENQTDVLPELNEPVLVILRKGPVTDIAQPKVKRGRSSPLVREANQNIQLIEEEIPDVENASTGGAKS